MTRVRITIDVDVLEPRPFFRWAETRWEGWGRDGEVTLPEAVYDSIVHDIPPTGLLEIVGYNTELVEELDGREARRNSLRRPEELTTTELREVVRRFQDVFYLSRTEGNWRYSAEKEHDSDTLMEAASILTEFGLAPEAEEDNPE